MKKLLICLIILLTTGVGLLSQTKEQLSVSKVDQNLYLEENRRVWIWTRYCYEIAYFTPAEYRRSKSGYEELYFIPTHTSCQIREISSHIPFDYEDTERR